MEHADRLAQDGQFVPEYVGSFLIAYLRADPVSSELTVYLEGDGARWPKGYPPRDPSPEDPFALRLALADPSPSVAYLGRPCQYLNDDQRATCPEELWTGARFGSRAISLTSEALDKLKEKAHARSIRLIGYSGGGALAALVASRRNDVRCLATIAAPLDTEEWTKAMGVSPLTKSLNPVNASPILLSISQSHFMGGRDTIVPPATAAHYLRRQPQARIILEPDYDHECCWVQTWRRRLESICTANS